VREKERGEGGDLWLFIASLALRRGLGLREGEKIDGQGGVGRGQGTGWRKRATPTGGPQASVAEKVTEFGIWRYWAVGTFSDWAELVPCGLFFLSYFFSPFFLISVFFIHNSCIFHSNQFNQVSKFFKSSTQCFKPVIKLVFKINDVFQ
jgi:hypothetical protein